MCHVELSGPTAVNASRNTQNKQNKQESSSYNVQFKISAAFLSVWVSSFQCRGYIPVPHVNVTARSPAQFNVLLFKESKCQSFPSADQTMNNCYFKENKSLVLKWQRFNRFRFKVKYIMQFCFPVLQDCIVLLCMCFDSIMWLRTGLMSRQSTAARHLAQSVCYFQPICLQLN